MGTGEMVMGHGPTQMDEVDILEREHGDNQDGGPKQITTHVPPYEQAGDEEIVVDCEEQQQWP